VECEVRDCRETAWYAVRLGGRLVWLCPRHRLDAVLAGRELPPLECAAEDDNGSDGGDDE